MITPEDRVRLRSGALGVVVVLLLGTLLARLWFLQILTGDRYASAAEGNRVRLVTVQPPRGRILDRNGHVLVKNRPSLAVAIRREDLRDRQNVIARLAKLIGIPEEKIYRRLHDKRPSPYAPVLIAEDVPADVIFQIQERQDEFPGVQSETLPVRTYPFGSLAAHVLGYPGEINETELATLKRKGYRLGDLIGRDGIERTYEADLRGRPGLDKFEVNARGIVLRTLGHQDAASGNDVKTSIDMAVQKVAEQSISLGILRARSQVFRETKKRFKATGGTAIVLDAKTGEVVAMASAPSFEPRRFVGGVDPKYYAYLNDPHSQFPLLNRATEAAYPPGSTFKPFMVSAALSSGAGTTSGGYPCTSQFEFGNRIFRNWTSRDATISIGQALVESCDTVFYRFAANWWRDEQLALQQGRKPGEIMQHWARRFGLGTPTSIDLPQEESGRVPDRAWKRVLWDRMRTTWCVQARTDAAYEDLCDRGYLWRGGDSVNMSVGQGDVEVTPLQLAVAYSALANGGNLVRPHIGMQIISPQGHVIRSIGAHKTASVGLPSADLSYIVNALAHVPTDGTARAPFAGWPFASIPVAAKTGSAEIGGKQPFSWFAAFAPANAPKYVVVSVVEEAGFGSQVAGPIVRRIMDQLFGRPLSGISFGARSD